MTVIINLFIIHSFIEVRLKITFYIEHTLFILIFKTVYRDTIIIHIFI